MSSAQFTLYSHKGAGPNPPKVALALEFLGLSYEVVPLVFGDGEGGVKNPKFLAINPNGRVPALVDHGNNDFVVWESGAILIYLAEKYDGGAGRLYGKTPEERAQVAQWLTHQLSGLGPSQGQVNWFTHYFEKASGVAAQPEVLKRYRDETDRLYKVLDAQLAKQEKAGSQYVVLDRVTLADFAFAGWVAIIKMANFDIAAYPHVQKWFENLSGQAYFQKAYAKIGA